MNSLRNLKWKMFLKVEKFKLRNVFLIFTLQQNLAFMKSVFETTNNDSMKKKERREVKLDVILMLKFLMIVY